MNRNNTVSVIEVASEGSNNQSNLSNSSANENDNETQRPVAVNSEVAQVPPSLHFLLVGEEKQSYEQFTREAIALNDKVEFKQKMRKILCCRICSELRRCPMFQCKYGHLICAGCLNDILSESRIQNEIASCPECQTTITKELCFRNVAVEKTISELPITCPFCCKEFPPANFKYHEYVSCGKRPSTCSNFIIGCHWQGHEKDRKDHEKQCTQLSANGYEILKSLETLDQKQKAGHDMYSKIMELLSIEKVSYTDLQLKQVKTENKNIIYETSKFSAFENQWMIRAYCHADVNKNVCYQLAVKSKLISPITLKYLILKGPYNDMDIRPNVDQFRFSEKAEDSPCQNLEIPSTVDKEAFYTAKRINIRIYMFIVR